MAKGGNNKLTRRKIQIYVEDQIKENNIRKRN